MSSTRAGPVDLSQEDDDEPPSSKHDANTVPPPTGAVDPYSAATAIVEVSPELLAKADKRLRPAPVPKIAPEAAAPARADLADLGKDDDGVELAVGTVVMPETVARASAPKPAKLATPPPPPPVAPPVAPALASQPRAAAPGPVAQTAPAPTGRTRGNRLILAVTIVGIVLVSFVVIASRC